jgi:hypothetical protein
MSLEDGLPGPAPAPGLDETEIPVVVAVHIRPLIEDELYSGCRACLAVTEGEPQVRARVYNGFAASAFTATHERTRWILVAQCDCHA